MVRWSDGERHGRLERVRAEARVLAEGGAGVSMADVRLLRGREVEPREEAHQRGSQAVASPRLQRASLLVEDLRGQEDRPEDQDGRSGHLHDSHGRDLGEHRVGRSSRGDGLARRLHDRRRADGDCDQDDHAGHQDGPRLLRCDTKFPRHEVPFCRSHTELCGGIIILLAYNLVNSVF